MTIDKRHWLPSARLLALALASSALFSSSLSSEPPTRIADRHYAVVDLGTLGGGASAAAAVDALGTVVGWSLTAGGERRAFLVREGAEMQDLGMLQNGSYAAATAVSDHGEWVAGNGGIRPLLDPELFMDINQGFVWNAEAMQSIGALYNPATFNRRFGTSEAHGVNDHGDVVGFSNVLRQNLQSAVLWKDGVLTDIGLANDTAANTRAFDVNNRGQVVGDIVLAGAASGESDAFLWQDGELEPLERPSGHTRSAAVAINELGHVVGWSGSGSQTLAVLWSSDRVEVLGALPGDENSEARAINALDQVVGWSGTAEQKRAFVWEAGVMTELSALLPPSSGWSLTEATDVNDRGVIVGTGLKDGHPRAFVLEPAPGSAMPVAACRGITPAARSVRSSAGSRRPARTTSAR